MSEFPKAKKPAATEAIDRYLSFSLGEEEYGIPLLNVKEVLAVPKITPIPFTPPHFLGVMNLRGQIVSTIDLRKKFGMKEVTMNHETVLIIVNLDPVFLGVVVDSVNKVLNATKAEISEPPDLLDVCPGTFLTGVVRKDMKLILLLDIAKTLDIEDLVAIQQNSNKAA